MKPILLLITLTALLTACAAPPADIPAASPGPSVEATRTRRPSQTPGPTKTLIPSHTPRPSEAATPLPTIPTFTPTFDVRTIVTATPGLAQCPQANPSVDVDLGLAKTAVCFKTLTEYDNPNQCVDREMQTKILDFLNQGGDINKIVAQLQAGGRQEHFLYQDFTHDGMKDLAFRNADSPYAGYYFYTCKDGKYISQPLWDGDPHAYLIRIKTIEDLNANGIPEIIVTAADVLIALEWNSYSFEETLRISDYGESYFEIDNSHGLRRIVLSRGFPPHWSIGPEFPWRHYVSVYAWNGSSYSRISKIFESPAYRFQAVQDADQYVIVGNYQQAIELYQETIFSNELGWWSSERRGYEFEKRLSGNAHDQPTLSPMPSEDTTEYPRLAAYAYYRMVILHTFLGETEAAQVKYATLQEKFPAGNPGQPYVEMATGFWNAYQSSGRMYDACAAAIAYADSHPEILIPLGSDYHGAQSHTYTPADVCPFR